MTSRSLKTPANIEIQTSNGRVVFVALADKGSPEEPEQRDFMIALHKRLAEAALPCTVSTRNQPSGGPDWPDAIVLEHNYA